MAEGPRGDPDLADAQARCAATSATTRPRSRRTSAPRRRRTGIRHQLRRPRREDRRQLGLRRLRRPPAHPGKRPVRHQRQGVRVPRDRAAHRRRCTSRRTRRPTCCATTRSGSRPPASASTTSPTRCAEQPTPRCTPTPRRASARATSGPLQPRRQLSLAVEALTASVAAAEARWADEGVVVRGRLVFGRSAVVDGVRSLRAAATTSRTCPGPVHRRSWTPRTAAVEVLGDRVARSGASGQARPRPLAGLGRVPRSSAPAWPGPDRLPAALPARCRRSGAAPSRESPPRRPTCSSPSTCRRSRRSGTCPREHAPRPVVGQPAALTATGPAASGGPASGRRRPTRS